MKVEGFPHKELVQFIRDRHGKRIGVLVSNEYNSIGWSLCNVRKERFDRDRGLAIARGRAILGSGTKVPLSIIETVGKFLERTRRYFK